MTKRTCLYDEHRDLGASFTDFGGWEMPVKYGSDLAEHAAVRERAGIFDLSHMGEIRVTGSQAAEFLDYALVGYISGMKILKAKYGMIVNAQGGILDDLITYRLAEHEFLVIPNASNVDVVWAAFQERAAGYDVELRNETDDTCMVAIQGPRALEILQKLVDSETGQTVRDMGYYSCVRAVVTGIDAMVARTGYTGEDGFEVLVNTAQGVDLWKAALGAGSEYEALPCGLASRDSLRLEAGMPLYGHELSADLTPFDPGFGRVVGLKSKGDFFARPALEAAKEKTPARKLVGLVGEGRRAARAGYAVVDGDGTVIGQVTSGMLSPTLGYPIAMAWVDRCHAETGSAVGVDLRGKALPFTIVDLPFYKRQK